MRIASVAPRPDELMVNGAATRTNAILGRLAERHEVRRFSQPRPYRLPEVRRMPHPRPYAGRTAALITELGHRAWPMAPLTTGIAAGATRPRELAELLRWAEVALVEFPWQYAHCARVAPPGLPLVLAAHNVEAHKFETYARALGVGRARAAPWLRFAEYVERRAYAHARLVLAVSECDRERLLERYGGDPDRVLVAANGADVKLLSPVTSERRAAARHTLGLEPGRPVALFIGAPAPPNFAALERVLAAARAREDVTFLIVGRVGGEPAREGNVVRTGELKDLRLAFDAADASLVPIDFGGGTKIKLIESMAAGLPVVAYEQSLGGLPLHHEEHLLVAPPDVAGLLAGLDRLLADRRLAGSLATAARKYVEHHLDWDSIAERIEAALLELVPARAAPLSAALLG
jgi:glycosyltransferase involved in cell wall biosynthesis